MVLLFWLMYYSTSFKAQEKVIRTKAAYESAVESLQKLLDKRDAQRKDELWNAIAKSSRTYDEILRYVVESADMDNNEG